MGSEKAKSQQQEQQDPLEKQQLSPSPGQEAGILPETEKAKAEENPGDSSSENSNGKEKLRIESPVLTGFDYQEATGLGTSTQPLTSSASSLTGFSNWSAAIAPSSSTIINEDASFFHQGGVPGASANNGALLFQNFPHHVSPGFGGSFSPQIGPLSQHHPHHPHFQHHHSQHQQQRRSPASPHPHLSHIEVLLLTSCLIWRIILTNLLLHGAATRVLLQPPLLPGAQEVAATVAGEHLKAGITAEG